MRALYGPQTELALALHPLLARGGQGMVWSPYSVASALGLVAAGANGPTRTEITDLIAPGVTLDDLAGALTGASRLDEESGDAEPRGADDGGSAMAVANTLWLRPDLSPLPGFERTLAAWPGSGVHATDFEGDLEGSRRRINAEVEKVTQGLIQELLQRGDLHPLTVAVLVNALWVKLAWVTPFAEELTEDLPFATPAGSRDVPTMQRTGRMSHAARDGWQLLSLPGAGGLTLDVLLPDTPSGDTPSGDTPSGDTPSGDTAPGDTALPDARTLGRLYGKAGMREVRLFLPRFEVRSALQLRPPLTELGVRQVFTDRADLTGITDASLMVDQVIHQAVLRADESGAEGAAATAVTMRLTSFRPPEPPLELRVDRPFLVILRNAGAILFLAHITDPGA